MLLTETPNYLSAAGLSWDIAGAWLLARGLLLKDQEILTRAGTGWNLTLPLVRSGCEQRLDTKFGLSLLLIGFAMQLVSSAFLSVEIGTAVFIALFVLVPVGWLIEHYKIWVLRDTFRILESRDNDPLQEETLRKCFQDYPERIWRMMTINSGYEFAEPPKN